ncbi:MAG: ABC transporter ATP-binding protein [Gammaproteobacteria bacterium]
MIALEDVRYRYDDRQLLSFPDIRAGSGEELLITGPSGSGKTTLIHLLAGLMAPVSGEVHVAGQQLSRLRGGRLDRFRGRFIGVVFQRLHLVPNLTVLDNLMLARFMAGLRQDRTQLMEILEALDMDTEASTMPQSLSFGQAQRVAVARAVVNEPDVILADEPTSALDDTNAVRTLDLLRNRAQACGATLVIATHDKRIKANIDYQYRLGEPPTD